MLKKPTTKARTPTATVLQPQRLICCGVIQEAGSRPADAAPGGRSDDGDERTTSAPALLETRPPCAAVALQADDGAEDRKAIKAGDADVDKMRR